MRAVQGDGMTWIKSKYVSTNELASFKAHIGYNYYGIGLVVYHWGVRFLLGWWQYCWHWKKPGREGNKL